MHGARTAARPDELLAGDALALVEAHPAGLAILSDTDVISRVRALGGRHVGERRATVHVVAVTRKSMQAWDWEEGKGKKCDPSDLQTARHAGPSVAAIDLSRWVSSQANCGDASAGGEGDMVWGMPTCRGVHGPSESSAACIAVSVVHPGADLLTPARRRRPGRRCCCSVAADA